MEPKIVTREEVKKERKTVNKKELENGKIRIRLIPIWLRIILLMVGVVFMALLGTFIGYSVMGDGKPYEIFDKETWSHITDLTGKSE